MLLQIELYVLGAMLVVMAAAWAFGLAAKNGGWTDVFWSFGTGLVLAVAALLAAGPDGVGARQVLVAAFMIVWGLRLGLYLAPRVADIEPPDEARRPRVVDRQPRLQAEVVEVRHDQRQAVATGPRIHLRIEQTQLFIVTGGQQQGLRWARVGRARDEIDEEARREVIVHVFGAKRHVDRVHPG